MPKECADFIQEFLVHINMKPAVVLATPAAGQANGHSNSDVNHYKSVGGHFLCIRHERLLGGNAPLACAAMAPGDAGLEVVRLLLDNRSAIDFDSELARFQVALVHALAHSLTSKWASKPPSAILRAPRV